MNRIIYFISIFLLSTIVKAQKPEPVHSIVKQDKPHEFFVEQAEQWWKEIEKNNKNEKAWYYYYKACRYAKMTFHDCNSPECEKLNSWIEESNYLKEQEDIFKLIEEAVPNTYTYYIFYKDGYPGDTERLDVLLKAYELEPENSITYDELVVNYETKGLYDKRMEFNKIWFNSNDLSSGILNYNYNVLMSMDAGGVLLTFGDNDTFPAWMLQDALDIRKDITVLNVHLLALQEYRNRIFNKLGIPELSTEYTNGSTQNSQDEIIEHIISKKPEKLSLYISTPSWKQFDRYEDNLYITGLVMQFSNENIDNIALLKNNFENKYALDYIRHRFSSDISQSIVNRTNVNYLPGLIKLYNHYKLSGEVEKASHIKELGLIVADKGGSNWKEKAEEIFE